MIVMFRVWCILLSEMYIPIVIGFLGFCEVYIILREILERWDGLLINIIHITLYRRMGYVGGK